MRAAVTGAFGYSGRYIAQALLDEGWQVITLTNSMRRPNPFGDRVAAYPFNFDRPDELCRALAGIDVLVNTYWVRFNHRLFSHAQAVANSERLFRAAKEAGVSRIIHVSITNPDPASESSYFRGKAEVEALLTSLGLSYCILRPGVLFGREDVLINNIAWGVRHLPVFGLFGDGRYRLQPIYVGDLASAAAAQASRSGEAVVQALGPETFTYRELVSVIADALGIRRPVLSLPPAAVYAGCRALGLALGDVIVTWDEVRSLMADRLYVAAPPLGTTKLSEWVAANRGSVGQRYTRELARRTDRDSAYVSN